MPGKPSIVLNVADQFCALIPTIAVRTQTNEIRNLFILRLIIKFLFGQGLSYLIEISLQSAKEQNNHLLSKELLFFLTKLRLYSTKQAFEQGITEKRNKNILMTFFVCLQKIRAFAAQNRAGCSSARLEYASGGRVVAGSNPVIPT